MDNTDKYYLLHNLTGGNVEVVASLIELIANKPKVATVRSLEDLKLSKYDVALDRLIDLKVSTIKDISLLIGASN